MPCVVAPMSCLTAQPYARLDSKGAIMAVIKEHLTHHRRHMLLCVTGAVILAVGLALSVAAVAIVGAAVCGAGCMSMVWMMVAAARSERRAAA
jgi:hypothetical protein